MAEFFVRFMCVCVSTCAFPWPENRNTKQQCGRRQQKEVQPNNSAGALYTKRSNTLVVVAGFISAEFRAWPRSGSYEQGFKENSLAHAQYQVLVHAQTTIVLKIGGSEIEANLTGGAKMCLLCSTPLFSFFSSHLFPSMPAPPFPQQHCLTFFVFVTATSVLLGFASPPQRLKLSTC